MIQYLARTCAFHLAAPVCVSVPGTGRATGGVRGRAAPADAPRRRAQRARVRPPDAARRQRPRGTPRRPNDGHHAAALPRLHQSLREYQWAVAVSVLMPVLTPSRGTVRKNIVKCL